MVLFPSFLKCIPVYPQVSVLKHFLRFLIKKTTTIHFFLFLRVQNNSVWRSALCNLCIFCLHVKLFFLYSKTIWLRKPSIWFFMVLCIAEWKKCTLCIPCILFINTLFFFKLPRNPSFCFWWCLSRVLSLTPEPNQHSIWFF